MTDLMEEQIDIDDLELPSQLPTLPLKDTVVFPDSVLPLAIGQERSVRLVEDVVSGSRLIALVASKDRELEQPGWEDLYEIGTAAVVQKMIRVPDGSLRILVQGISRIRLPLERCVEGSGVRGRLPKRDLEPPDLGGALRADALALAAQVSLKLSEPCYLGRQPPHPGSCGVFCHTSILSGSAQVVRDRSILLRPRPRWVASALDDTQAAADEPTTHDCHEHPRDDDDREQRDPVRHVTSTVALAPDGSGLTRACGPSRSRCACRLSRSA